MPAVIAVLWASFYSMIGTLVGRVLFSLGMGFFTYGGISIMLDQIKAQVIANFSGAGGVILGILATAKVDQCISILFSAVLIKFTLAGMNKANGTITKLGVKS